MKKIEIFSAGDTDALKEIVNDFLKEISDDTKFRNIKLHYQMINIDDKARYIFKYSVMIEYFELLTK